VFHRAPQCACQTSPETKGVGDIWLCRGFGCRLDRKSETICNCRKCRLEISCADPLRQIRCRCWLDQTFTPYIADPRDGLVSPAPFGAVIDVKQPAAIVFVAAAVGPQDLGGSADVAKHAQVDGIAG